MVGLTSCKESSANKSKFVLNEVLIENDSNFQDDYGKHSAWVEIFNTTFGSADLAAHRLSVCSGGDTTTYIIPKGDVLTILKPRQHSLFWADGKPSCGTFHTSITLDPAKDNWVGLYDAGRKLIDEVIIPGGTLTVNQSYARVGDGDSTWEVKDGSGDKYVTPSTNNKTIMANTKMAKFETHDSMGIGMALTSMCVVFLGLILLYVCFRSVGKLSVLLRQRRAMESKGITDVDVAKQSKLGSAPGEVYAAISMAMFEHLENNVHDVEETVLTMTRVKRSYSPWSSRIYTLRGTPFKFSSPRPHKK